MAFNTAIAKVIKKVSEISGIGTSVTYRKVNSGTYNSTTGEVLSEPVEDTTVKGVFENINFREVNDLIQVDDRKCTIAANSLSFTPKTADKLIASGVTYQIIRVRVNEQGGVNLSYELYLRA